MGRYITFEALNKIASAIGWTEELRLIVGNEEDTKNYQITDETLIAILKNKGLIPEFGGGTGTGDGDTITDIQFDSSTSELTIVTDKGSFTINLQQNYKVTTLADRDALITTIGESELIGSQVFVSDNTTTYRYDGNGTWFEFTDTPAQASPVLTKDITNNLGEDIGGITDQETLLTGLTYTDFVQKLITKIFNPTFTNPSFSLSKSADTLQKVGATVNFNLTFNFNRGSINGDLSGGIWNPGLVQDFRAGAASSYTIDGTSQAGNILAVSKVIALGNQSYSATVEYLEGPQPLNSIGEIFDTKYPAGVSSAQTTTIEGVYPLFATTSAIATATEQTLLSMLTANNIEKTLVAESGGNKQFFDIPNAWLTSRPITKVEFFNTVSGSFDTTNQLSTFTQTATTQTIEGNVINYTRFTNNTANRGSILIKIIF